MIAAYYALHYGKEYLAWSVRSIQDAVDEIWMFYADEPSYGHTQHARCPDGIAELTAEAQRFATKPVHWRSGRWSSEGEHRDHAVSTLRTRGASTVLVVDADEVWAPGAAAEAINASVKAGNAGRWMVPFLHFWRSTKYVVRDHFTPIRILDLRVPDCIDAVLETRTPVLHFGYAQSVETMRYKWTCHGHQAELRSGWLDRYANWKDGDEDLHPVVIDLWKRAERVDAATALVVKEALADHPYLGVEMIQ